jgi:hypothetical protein
VAQGEDDLPGQDHDRGRPHLGEALHERGEPDESAPNAARPAAALPEGKAATLAGGQSMIWAMPVREDQARASACDYDGTVVHDGQLEEETVAEPVRLATSAASCCW